MNRSLLRRLPDSMLAIVTVAALGSAFVLAGCPGMQGTGTQPFFPPPSPIIPTPPAEQPDAGGGTNVPPTLTFNWPTAPVTIQVGGVILVQWTVADPDDAARVSIFARDLNGSDVVLVSGQPGTSPQSSHNFPWNTTGFAAGNYQVVGVVSDGRNDPTTIVASGLITLQSSSDTPPPPPPPPPSPDNVPVLTFQAPSLNQTVETGQPVQVTFSASDFENNAANPTLSVSVVARRVGGGLPDITIFQSAATPNFVNFQPAPWVPQPGQAGVFNFIGTASDGTGLPGHVVTATAGGAVTVLEQGTGQTNNPPFVDVLLPGADRGLLDGDVLGIQAGYGNFELNETIQIRVTLDTDDNADNNSNGEGLVLLAERQLTPDFFEFDLDGDGLADTYVPNQFFPGYINGLLDGFFDIDEDGFLDFIGAFIFVWEVDASQVPPITDPITGEPLPRYVRVEITDDDSTQTTYATGRIVIQQAASANNVVDMKNAESRLAAARFQGFQTNDHFGTDFLPLGLFVPDFDGCQVPPFDNADEFMILSRYGTPRSRRMGMGASSCGVGAAFLVYGRESGPESGRFSGTVLATAISTPTIPGAVFGSNIASEASPPVPPNLVAGPGSLQVNDNQPILTGPGISSLGLTSAALTQDVTNDGLPELVFGTPFMSALYDRTDFDPCDCEQEDGGVGCSFGCAYVDLLDGLGSGTSGSQCPGDDDLGHEISGVPIDSGYAYWVRSFGTGLTPAPGYCEGGGVSRFIDLGLVGQGGASDTLRSGHLSDEGEIFATDGGGFTSVTNGARFRGISYAGEDAEFGRTVSAIPGLHDLQFGSDSLLISAPGVEIVRAFLPEVFDAPPLQSDDTGNFSHPRAFAEPRGAQTAACNCSMDNGCMNGLRFTGPLNFEIRHVTPGSRLGYAKPAGDFNHDSLQDILCGAPNLPGVSQDGSPAAAGRTIIIYNAVAGIGNTMIPLGTNPPVDAGQPRLELYGTHAGDRFGISHSEATDVDGDGLSDVVLSSGQYDNGASVDAGLAAVVFSRDKFLGTPRLVASIDGIGVGTNPFIEGVRFIGTPGSRAGTSVGSAGDYDGDGFGDILISAPGEIRLGSDGVPRRGVVYLVYGGPDLLNAVPRTGDPTVDFIALSRVANTALDTGNPPPTQGSVQGIVFVSPYAAGDPVDTDATFESAGGIGDVDGDGFDDIMIGAPRADFVDPVIGAQRQVNAGAAFLVYGNSQGR